MDDIDMQPENEYEQMQNQIDWLDLRRLDLLSALEYLRDCIETGTDPAMERVNAAIRKARGES